MRETEADKEDVRGSDLHRQVFERNLAVQLLIDPLSGRIVEANPAACRFYGYSRDQLTALKITEINTMPPEQLERHMQEAAAENRNEFHFRHRTASGDVRDVEVHSGPVEWQGRKLLYSIIHDVTDRRRAESALRDSEASFRLLFADHPLPMWVYALDDLRILEVNEAAVARYGWSRSEFLGMSIAELRPPDDLSRLMGAVDEIRQGRRLTRGVWRHRLRDGTVVEVEIRSNPLGFGGRPCVLVVAEDVTDRRRAEQDLRRSEEKYREILDGIEEGYYEVDREGHLLFHNEALRRLLGYDREEMEGFDCARALDADNSARRQVYFQQVLESGQPVPHASWTIRRKDGSFREVDASVSLVRDHDGRPVGFRGLLADVSEQRAREAALLESEDRFRRLVEMSPDGIGVHTEGRFRFCNTAFARLMGARGPDDIVGRSVLEFVHPDSRTLVVERQRQLSADGTHLPLVEEKLVRLDGTVIDVEVAASPFVYRNQPAVQLVVRDITPRKQAETLQKALYRIAQTSSAVADMPAFYAAIHGIVGELMYARNFYVALRDEASGRIRFEYFVDEEDPVAPEFKPGKSLTEFVLRTGEPLLASGPVFDELEDRGEVELFGASSVDWLGVPLKRGDVTFGVLVVQSYQQERRFTPRDRDLLTFVSQHVATAIDRKRASDALRESEARFRTLAETAPSAIFIVQDDVFRYANPALSVITGYARPELLRMSLWDLVHPAFADELRAQGLISPRVGDSVTPQEFKIRRKDGHERWVEFSAGATEVDGREAVLGTAFDITTRKRAEEQIKSLAYHDPLTGLPNRLLFHDRLTVAVAQAHRQVQRLAVLFLDLDRFKVINDSLGHSTGDRLLQGVARRLEAGVREGDTVARLGGDEFTLLLPGIARAVDAAKVAEKLLEGLKHPFDVDNRELYVSASVGISIYPEDGVDAEALIKNADTAMYRAKEQGRDNYQLYTHTMNATAVERLALEGNLRQALARHELRLHYQPIRDLHTRRVHGLEALLRWQHPGRGLVPPSEFIPLAEVTGLILGMGPWILRTACQQVREWQDQGHPDLTVAVNLSARQFTQPDLVAHIKEALQDSGLPARCLDLEITESNAMQNAEATIHTLRELKTLGVRISIDDFGIGYSSLSYLKRLPIDTLKIDQSFVRDITTDPDDAAIATAVIALAHTLKLKVVAEGVETEEQLVFLAARHCDRMQGYLFSPALAPEQCGEFLARNRHP